MKVFWILCFLFLTLPRFSKSNEEAEEAPAGDEEKPEETPEEAAGENEAEGTGEEEEEEAEEKAEEAEEGGQELTCNKQIVETYGMVGLDVAKPMALDMCESITHSCCQVTDQVKIYENWVEGGEDVDLTERFKYHMRVGFEANLRFITWFSRNWPKCLRLPRVFS